MTGIRIVGLGNDEHRSFFILTRDAAFAPAFTRFLIDCGFPDGAYEDEVPSSGIFAPSLVHHWCNAEYDLDVVFTADRIIVIVRTDPANRSRVVAGIERMVSPRVTEE